jgi:molecular chaperone DnaJ
VAIPPGAEDGSTRRVPGQGEPGRRGGSAGDLNVIVRVKPHAIFRREGDLVVCEVPISMIEATLGAVVQVPTLDGRVEMRVPPGTQSGTLFRLRGKGIVKGTGRGDAHVKVLVETPSGLSDEQRRALEKLALEPKQFPLKAAFLDKLGAK